MRACFLGQNVCALGYGVATLQTPPLKDEDASQDGKADEAVRPGKHDRLLVLPGLPGAGASKPAHL